MRIVPTLAVAVLAVVRPAVADEPAKPEGEKHWSYTSGITPPKWGEVSQTCATGGHQSPIALSKQQAKVHDPLRVLEFYWSKSTGELVDTGHSYQVNLPPGNFIKYGGVRYDLQQFHFHTPSEHTLNGKAAPMEAHFVHKSPEGKLGVVGVFLKEGSAPSPFAPVLTALPPTGEKRSVEVDLPALLPESHWHFLYSGSLTTPPCSEKVGWVVMQNPVEVSKAEIDAFQAKYPKNARPVQQLHGRRVEISP
ncbi:MAG TPA: carbonic anhydrase family protein [Myxococcaceae bacterium]|nr:carbonic anhydrase family protein [Myxococcaceae bacterium]